MVDTIARELLRGRSSEDEVTLQAGVHNLADNLLIREAHNKTVLRRVVLVLRLGDEPLACIVVGLAFSPTAVLDLETREVRVRFLLLHERHLQEEEAKGMSIHPYSSLSIHPNPQTT